jgi:alcohol dehydrogenase class IV
MQTGTYNYVPIERVSWGKPATEAVVQEADRIGATRVFCVASGTLSRKTDVISAVQHALGARYVGLFDECREHTPLQSVIECADAVRAAQPNLIVTIGGGTPIDTVKIVQLCLSHNIRDIEGLLALANKPNSKPSTVRQIIVPTTLSGGEYTSVGGGTDVSRKTKDMYLGPDLCGRAVILDPAISVHTPMWLWLSTAIRALDHAIEGFCAPGTNAMVQATSIHAMKLLSKSLRETKKSPLDLDARQNSQLGVWLAASGLGRVSMGASHGIGYLLGTICGVPHGYTSCVMLPAVLRWNESVISHIQSEIASALGMPGASASEAVASLLDELELPRRLSDVRVTSDQIGEIAERAPAHPVVKGNPRPVRDKSDAMEILSLAS